MFDDAEAESRVTKRDDAHARMRELEDELLPRLENTIDTLTNAVATTAIDVIARAATGELAAVAAAVHHYARVAAFPAFAAHLRGLDGAHAERALRAWVESRSYVRALAVDVSTRLPAAYTAELDALALALADVENAANALVHHIEASLATRGGAPPLVAESRVA
jgi:hypothetical protein